MRLVPSDQSWMQCACLAPFTQRLNQRTAHQGLTSGYLRGLPRRVFVPSPFVALPSLFGLPLPSVLFLTSAPAALFLPSPGTLYHIPTPTIIE